jgi:hypothetical protein
LLLIEEKNGPPKQAKKPEIISRLPQAQPDSSHH